MLRLLLRCLVLVVSAVVMTSFVMGGLQRALDLSPQDPGEKAIFEGAQRIACGQPLYDEASVSSTPAPMPGYTYMYTYASGGHDLRFRHLRWLAMGIALALAVVVAALVQLETGSFTLALASGAFVLLALDFAPGAPIAARPEVLMLLLVVLGFSVLRFTQGIWGALLSAPLFAAAYFVDQHTAWFLAAALVFLGMEGRARLLTFTLVSGLMMAAGFVLLSQRLGPWFNFNVWDAPLGSLYAHPGNALRYLTNHLLGKFSVWVLAALLAFAMPTQPWVGKRGMWMFLALAAIAGCLVSTQTNRFDATLLIPGMVALALLGPIMVQRVAHHLSAGDDPDLPGSEGVIVTALALQFLVILSAMPIGRWVPDLASLSQLHL